MPVLRRIDAGSVSALRSQALWHGIAAAMGPEDPPVLSFCRPEEPYVCLGYHRRLAELDLDACAARGLPVLRRQIGGGPVYLDADQLFFQLTLPARRAPAHIGRLYERMLGPAAAALCRLGVPARLAHTNDIVAGGRKISGTGAGQIGDGVVVVANVMFAFAHEEMAAILSVPDQAMRDECLRLMRAHLGTLPRLDPDTVTAALTDAYADALGATVSDSALSDAELAAVRDWERRLDDPAWTAGPPLPASAGRQVKIRAGVWVYDRRGDGLAVQITVEDGRVVRAAITLADAGVDSAVLERALIGVAAEAGALAARLEEFGDDGVRVRDALAPGMVVR